MPYMPYMPYMHHRYSLKSLSITHGVLLSRCVCWPINRALWSGTSRAWSEGLPSCTMPLGPSASPRDGLMIYVTGQRLTPWKNHKPQNIQNGVGPMICQDHDWWGSQWNANMQMISLPLWFCAIIHPFLSSIVEASRDGCVDLKIFD